MAESGSFAPARWPRITMGVAKGTCGLIPILSYAGRAHAHDEPGSFEGPFGVFLAGLSHPVLGPDHFLAMFSVGLLSAVLGGRHFWRVPLMFVACMPIGWWMGRSGTPFPPVETGIALSVILLGAGTMWAGRMPLPLVYLTVGSFALFHGYAHGSEMPPSADPGQYASGFMVGTVAIHLLGLFVGDMLHRDVRPSRAERVLAGAVMLAGLWFLLSVAVGSPGAQVAAPGR